MTFDHGEFMSLIQASQMPQSTSLLLSGVVFWFASCFIFAFPLATLGVHIKSRSFPLGRLFLCILLQASLTSNSLAVSALPLCSEDRSMQFASSQDRTCTSVTISELDGGYLMSRGMLGYGIYENVVIELDGGPGTLSFTDFNTVADTDVISLDIYHDGASSPSESFSFSGSDQPPDTDIVGFTRITWYTGFMESQGAGYGWVLKFTCSACPAGSFKVETCNGDCELCPLGTWSNTTGAAASCIPCIAGSTTAFEGAWNEDSCIRPRSGQDFLCTSGQVCTLQIEGFQLRDGHRLSITSSTNCGVAQVVPNIAQEGMSQTNDGSIYSWGHLSLMDFVPQGGENYGLCWCANMQDLTCNTLQSYQISAGQLQVVGPFSNHLFHCVRGQDCTGLQPVEGVGLGDNQVALRSNGCGSSSFLQISLTNKNVIANLQSLPANDSFVTFSLSFGISIPEEGLDHTLLLDSSESGYDLCWCSQTLGSHDV